MEFSDGDLLLDKARIHSEIEDRSDIYASDSSALLPVCWIFRRKLKFSGWCTTGFQSVDEGCRRRTGTPWYKYNSTSILKVDKALAGRLANFLAGFYVSQTRCFDSRQFFKGGRLENTIR